MAKTKKKKPVGYICGTAPTDLWLGATDIIIYPTVKALKKARSCWKECGIMALYAGEMIEPSKMHEIY